LTTDLVAEAKSELEHDGHGGIDGPTARAGAANRESPREKH
jgi:hypothetical protein